jgi:hypothetical protein
VAINPALIRPVLPGKVMRLMAADLAAWHRMKGETVDPNTQVWANLPAPWLVLCGSDRGWQGLPRLYPGCTADQVEETCRAFGLDPVRSGWTGFRETGTVSAITMTPELVHGVEIADAQWAAILKQAGVFSAKKAAPDAGVLRSQADMAGVITGPLPSREAMGIEMVDEPARWGV